MDSLVEARQKLESQQQENQGVQKEFNSLDDDSNIYKLIGPVLLKQDKNEALMAVNGRLEFIEKEMCVEELRSWDLLWEGTSSGCTDRVSSKRIEGQIKENQDKSDKMRAEVRGIYEDTD